MKPSLLLLLAAPAFADPPAPGPAPFAVSFQDCVAPTAERDDLSLPVCAADGGGRDEEEGGGAEGEGGGERAAMAAASAFDGAIEGGRRRGISVSVLPYAQATVGPVAGPLGGGPSINVAADLVELNLGRSVSLIAQGTYSGRSARPVTMETRQELPGDPRDPHGRYELVARGAADGSVQGGLGARGVLSVHPRSWPGELLAGVGVERVRTPRTATVTGGVYRDGVLVVPAPSETVEISEGHLDSPYAVAGWRHRLQEGWSLVVEGRYGLSEVALPGRAPERETSLTVGIGRSLRGLFGRRD